MHKQVKPKVIVSKCLGFANCRYNGASITSTFVDQLRPFVEFSPVCPEVEIGLGVPRNPIRLISIRGLRRLIQPATGLDVTEKMSDFINRLLSSITVVDGFVLKGSSPSCGIKNVKIYASQGGIIERGSGFFGGRILEQFPDLPIEDEERLTNAKLREHFLTRLFALARFRAVKEANSMNALVAFHSQQKYLLMAYNATKLKLLGRIVANLERKSYKEVIEEYAKHFFTAFARLPRFTSNINVLQHSAGFFSKYLNAKEKAFFNDLLNQYRANKIPLIVPLNVVKSWIIRFGNDYLSQQTYFQPYPVELMTLADSGKGRNFS
ncbi:MAG: DUF523 and DUF1722 domain-containing protein [Candidatus Sumerlaeia bacterium]|nr:DUF523 and DUF1722 domain-containing protein [Candidatus Sumerlaeia bacterium]